jgi:NTE family protein
MTALQSPQRRPKTARKVRRGLVLGAGGALGAAWMVGALRALVEIEGFDAGDSDIVVGTSAGSVLAALIGCGWDVEEMVHRLDVAGEPHVEGTGAVNAFDVHSALAAIPRPRPLPGNLLLAAKTLGKPHRHTVMTIAAGLAPKGRGTLEPVGELVADAQNGGAWPTLPTTWIVAMDYDAGKRTVFGRDGAPEAMLAEAVMASSSAPGFFPPVDIGARRYVDGGAVSMTNADVLLGRGLDEVLVLAPMATYTDDHRGSMVSRADRRVRGVFTRRLNSEISKLRADGVSVRVIAPTADDLRSMGVNVMNPARRRAVLHTAMWTTKEQLLDAAKAPAKVVSLG